MTIHPGGNAQVLKPQLAELIKQQERTNQLLEQLIDLTLICFRPHPNTGNKSERWDEIAAERKRVPQTRTINDGLTLEDKIKLGG